MGAITRGLANNILSGGRINATAGLTGTVSASNITDSSISSVTAFPAAAGDFIQSTASDPSPATLGDVWYNNATYALKVAAATTVGTWAAGGNMANARYGQAGFGTQTAALVAGGINGPTYKPQTELYNGTTWTANPTGMNANKYNIAGAGTQTAGVAFGSDGAPGGQTELWNGSVWTNNPTGLNFGGEALAGCGTQTAALAIGGLRPVGPTGIASNKTESFNGSTWTAVGNLNTARNSLAAAGILTAALAFGGSGPSSATESWNGTSWTSVNSMNTARSGLGGAGTQTLAVAFGGDVPPVTGATELWNVTSWTASTSMSTARSSLSGAGTQASGLAFAGNTGTTGSSATEEFTGPGSPVTQTLTTS